MPGVLPDAGRGVAGRGESRWNIAHGIDRGVAVKAGFGVWRGAMRWRWRWWEDYLVGQVVGVWSRVDRQSSSVRG